MSVLLDVLRRSVGRTTLSLRGTRMSALLVGPLIHDRSSSV